MHICFWEPASPAVVVGGQDVLCVGGGGGGFRKGSMC